MEDEIVVTSKRTTMKHCVYYPVYVTAVK